MDQYANGPSISAKAARILGTSQFPRVAKTELHKHKYNTSGIYVETRLVPEDQFAIESINQAAFQRASQPRGMIAGSRGTSPERVLRDSRWAHDSSPRLRKSLPLLPKEQFNSAIHDKVVQRNLISSFGKGNVPDAPSESLSGISKKPSKGRWSAFGFSKLRLATSASSSTGREHASVAVVGLPRDIATRLFHPDSNGTRTPVLRQRFSFSRISRRSVVPSATLRNPSESTGHLSLSSKGGYDRRAAPGNRNWFDEADTQTVEQVKELVEDPHQATHEFQPHEHYDIGAAKAGSLMSAISNAYSEPYQPQNETLNFGFDNQRKEIVVALQEPPHTQHLMRKDSFYEEDDFETPKPFDEPLLSPSLVGPTSRASRLTRMSSSIGHGDSVLDLSGSSDGSFDDELLENSILDVLDHRQSHSVYVEDIPDLPLDTKEDLQIAHQEYFERSLRPSKLQPRKLSASASSTGASQEQIAARLQIASSPTISTFDPSNPGSWRLSSTSMAFNTPQGPRAPLYGKPSFIREFSTSLHTLPEEPPDLAPLQLAFHAHAPHLMAVTKQEQILLSSIRRKRTAMQRQQYAEGYKQAIREEIYELECRQAKSEEEPSRDKGSGIVARMRELQRRKREADRETEEHDRAEKRQSQPLLPLILPQTLARSSRSLTDNDCNRGVDLTPVSSRPTSSKSLVLKPAPRSPLWQSLSEVPHLPLPTEVPSDIAQPTVRPSPSARDLSSSIFELTQTTTAPYVQGPRGISEPEQHTSTLDSSGTTLAGQIVGNTVSLSPPISVLPFPPSDRGRTRNRPISTGQKSLIPPALKTAGRALNPMLALPLPPPLLPERSPKRLLSCEATPSPTSKTSNADGDRTEDEDGRNLLENFPVVPKRVPVV